MAKATKPVRVHRTIQVQFDKGESREETLLGRDYLAVPCVAMIEGVRFGANQEEPELGLASEFGDTPIAWSNRPVVLNHPQVDGTYVSANSPNILQDYQFGLTMNPSLDDDKLKLEVWIDTARVNELGGDFQDAYDRIVAEEDVEVSVGFFSDLEKRKGKFKGQSYGAVWRNIKPDHLAILSEDLIGACSVDDGCGVPRLNEKGENMAKLLTATPPAPTAPTAQCSCGGQHTQAEHVDDVDDTKPVTQKGLKAMIADLLKPFTQSKEDKALEAHKAQRALNETIINSIDSSLMDKDIKAMISRALEKKMPNNYIYLLGYTQDKAIFEKLDTSTYSYLCYQIGINVSDSKVEFVGEPEEVILQTKIVPQIVGQVIPEVNTQENDMTKEEKDAADLKAQNEAAAAAAAKTTPAVTTPITQAATPTVETPKVQTTQEYIAAAPQEIRELLQASLNIHEEKKNGLLKVLKDSKANRFTEEYLKAQPLEVLENMVALLPGTYAGVAPSRGPVLQANGESKTVPAPKVFEPKVVKKEDQAAA